MRYAKLWVWGVVALAMCAGCTSFRPTPKEATPLEELAEAEAPLEPIYFTIGPGDELQITVWNIPELNQTATVDPNGEISVPIAGTVTATGKTITEVTQSLQQKFEEYYIGPEVNVSVKTMRSNKVSVLGEVNRPGVFTMDSETRLMDALAMAGNFTGDAEPRTVALIRGDLNAPHIVLLDVKKLISQGDVRQNVALQKGDVIYVPQSYIASVTTFFERLYIIVRPVVEIERGISLKPAVEDAIEGEDRQTIQVVR
jgi:polysaccharide export outer membrane protein